MIIQRRFAPISGRFEPELLAGLAGIYIQSTIWFADHISSTSFWRCARLRAPIWYRRHPQSMTDNELAGMIDDLHHLSFPQASPIKNLHKIFIQDFKIDGSKIRHKIDSHTDLLDKLIDRACSELRNPSNQSQMPGRMHLAMTFRLIWIPRLQSSAFVRRYPHSA